MARALIADIGGTNARFGVVDKNGIHDLVYLECRNYAGPTEAALDYMKRVGLKEMPQYAAFAVAGPVHGDLVNFTQSPWTFRTSTVQKNLGFAKLDVMNDFEAVALAVPTIDENLLHHMCGPDQPEDKQNKGVLGPGTGLGMASLFWSGNKYGVAPGEGGHMTMPATTQREFDIFNTLHVKYHHISAERVCSGKGLENLYSAIRVLDKRDDLPLDRDAAEISKAAMAGTCDVCKESLDLMLAFLGRVAGNQALVLNALGGIYIAGGIPTKLGDYFFTSRFVEEFQSKGRMRHLMERVPVYLVKHDAIGLLGLQATAQQNLTFP